MGTEITSVIWLFIIPAFVSILIEMAFLPCVISLSEKMNLMDSPTQRKNHLTPTSRLGGITFFPTVLISFVLYQFMCNRIGWPEYPGHAPGLGKLCIGIALLYVTGLVDDVISVNFKIKLCAQMIAAYLLTLGGLGIQHLLTDMGMEAPPLYVDRIITLFLIIYITNAINFIDGIDGLAGSIGVLALLVYVIVSFHESNHALAFLCLSTTAVLCVFLFFGIHGSPIQRKKIFMGDTGSQTLGFFISYVLLVFISTPHGTSSSCNNLIAVVLSPILIPLLDVAHVVYVRFRNHSSIFLPDRRHIHHLLLDTGLSPHATLITLLLLTICYILLNTILSLSLPNYIIAAIDIIAWLVIIQHINKKIK